MKSIQPRNTYREGGDKWSNLDSILLRGGTQVGDTDFTLQVFSVFALPELYSKLYQSGSVDAWIYIVKFYDIQLPSGKYNQREM